MRFFHPETGSDSPRHSVKLTINVFPDSGALHNFFTDVIQVRAYGPRTSSKKTTREDFFPLGHSEHTRSCDVRPGYTSGGEINSDTIRVGDQGLLKSLNRERSYLSSMALLGTVCGCPAVCIG